MRTCSVKLTFIAAITTMVIYIVYAVFITPLPSMWMPKYLKRNIKMTQTYIQKFPGRRPKVKKTFKILLWTTWFRRPKWNLDDFNFSMCECSSCVLTDNKVDLNASAALLFHPSDFDMPTVYQSNFMPEVHQLDQVWILQNSEPPSNLKVDLASYNNVFNWTATYRKDSDIYMPYVNIMKRRTISKTSDNIASSKSKGLAWVASNCGDHARRQMLVRELRKYVQVDTFGECGDKKLSRSEASEVLSKYKFYLAFESAYCVDYITEKFSAALSRHQIPIVSGAGNYSTVAPPNSYINVLDFDSVEHLARHVQFLDRNDSAYNQYLQWTREYEVDGTGYMENGMCEICKRLHGVTVTSQVYVDVAAYFRQDTCPIWTYLSNKYRSIQGWLIHFGYV